MTTHLWKKGIVRVKTTRYDPSESTAFKELGPNDPHQFYSEISGEIFGDLAIAPFLGIWRIFHMPTATTVGIDCDTKSQAKKTVEKLVKFIRNWSCHDVVEQNKLTMARYEALIEKSLGNGCRRITLETERQLQQRAAIKNRPVPSKTWEKGAFIYNHIGEGLIESPDGKFAWKLPALGLIKKEGFTYGHFGIAKMESKLDGKYWGIFHLPSLNRFFLADTKNDAMRLVEMHMATKIDWGFSSFEEILSYNKKTPLQMIEISEKIVNQGYSECDDVDEQEENHECDDVVIPMIKPASGPTQRF